jgi:hypothetical protein
MRRGTAGRVVAVSAVAALAVSCGAAAEPEEPAAELSGRIRQSNLDQSLASIRVQLRNDGAEPVEVEDVVLHAPPFPDSSSETKSTIAPGRRIDFRFVYGDPTCSGATPTPEPATAQAVANGRRIEVDAEDSQDVLRRLLTLYCDRRRLAEVVTVKLGESWTPEPAGDVLLGTIELRRVAGAAEVSVQRMMGSVVFQIHPVTPAEPIAVLGAGQDMLSVPVRATALRCDPHALAEGKKNYVFAVWLGLADGPNEVKVELVAEPGLRPTFDSLCPDPVAPGVGS